DALPISKISWRHRKLRRGREGVCDELLEQSCGIQISGSLRYEKLKNENVRKRRFYFAAAIDAAVAGGWPTPRATRRIKAASSGVTFKRLRSSLRSALAWLHRDFAGWINSWFTEIVFSMLQVGQLNRSKRMCANFSDVGTSFSTNEKSFASSRCFKS